MDVSLTDFKLTLGLELRLLGLDVGKKTIGLAISNSAYTIGSPLETIRRTKFTKDAERISEVVEENEIGGLVIGLPINMDGSEGPRCQSVRQFSQNLEKMLGIPYVFWDERLSTAVVERMLVEEADMSRKRRAQVVDKLAAAYILQGALDAMAAQ
jgi:putative Holliday junction resolvase